MFSKYKENYSLTIYNYKCSKSSIWMVIYEKLKLLYFKTSHKNEMQTFILTSYSCFKQKLLLISSGLKNKLFLANNIYKINVHT